MTSSPYHLADPFPLRSLCGERTTASACLWKSTAWRAEPGSTSRSRSAVSSAPARVRENPHHLLVAMSGRAAAPARRHRTPGSPSSGSLETEAAPFTLSTRVGRPRVPLVR